MKRPLQTLWLVLVLSAVPVLWLVLDHNEVLERAEQWTMDQRFRLRGPIGAPIRVVYVDIDSISLESEPGKGIGGWPWTRGYFATVARGLIEYGGVKAVGIDVVFSRSGVAESTDREKMQTGNREFARYLHGEPPVVLAAAFSATDFYDANGTLYQRQLPLVATELPPLPQIEGPEVPVLDIGTGTPYEVFAVGLIDDPFLGRAMPLWAPSNVKTYHHIAVELLRRYWDLPLEEEAGIRIGPDHLELVREDGEVVRRVPLRDRQVLEINWFSPWSSEEHNPRFSFYDVFLSTLRVDSGDPAHVAQGEAFFAQDVFKDAIVLIGPTDPLLQDLAPTPFDEVPVPKVGVHGNVIKTIASERYLQRPTEAQAVGLLMLLTVIVATLSVAGGRRQLLARGAAAAAVAGYVVLAGVVFTYHDVVLPLVGPVGSALSTTFLAVAWQAWQEQKAKGRIKGMFGTYLSPAVVETMVESGRDPELGGHDAEITAYFSDIQSFSSFSEVLTSSQLGELLNEYLTVCTDIIQSEGGTLDKYIGDAVVAMFGAPVDLEAHAYKACLASQLVHRQLDELRRKWAGERGKWPELVHQMRTRIGLNTGMCMIGNMGSRTRFNYTMMGDNVNLAARMESGAKSWGAFTMVTESTRLACEKHGAGRMVFRPLGRIQVKGRSASVPIHEVLGLTDDLKPATRDCLGLFAEGMERYYARDWNGAMERFERSAELEPLRPKRDPGVKANPSLVYQEIVAEMKVNPPPEGWDGVYVMTEK